jgi:hypothetical protein
MSINRQAVIDRYPEFSDIEDSTYFTAVIVSATRQVSQSQLNELYIDALLALTAHFLELGRAYRQGRSGSITEEEVGQLSRKFNVLSMGSGSLYSTSYGQEFKRIAKIGILKTII